jgi:hypothetical protein
MSKINLDSNKLTKWTWYLFLFANIILLIGIGIAWAIMRNSSESAPVAT